MPNDLDFQDLINPRPGVGPDPRILEDYAQPVLDQAAGVAPGVVVDKTKPVNPVAQMIRDERAVKVDELRTRLKNSAELSVRVNRSPKVMELSRHLNLPPETVANKLPLLDRPMFNADQLMTHSPTLAEWSANPLHLAAAKDDLPNLSGMERSIRAQGAAVRQSGRTMDVFNWQKELFKEGINNPNAPFSKSAIPAAIDKINQSATSEDQVLQAWRNKHASVFEEGLGLAIENAGPMASSYIDAAKDTAWAGGAVALITGVVTRNPGLVARTAAAAMKKAAPYAMVYEFALGEAGANYYEYMTQKDANGKPVPMDQHVALAAAAISGTISGLAETGLGIEGLLIRKASPLKTALKTPTVRAAIMKYAGVIARMSVEEGGEEVFQKIMSLGFNPEVAEELVNKDRTPDENVQVFLSKLFTEDNIKAMGQEGRAATMATPFLGGVMVSPAAVADIAQARQSQRQQKATETLLRQAQQAAEVKTEMEKVGEHVAASNAESVNQVPVAEMAKDHPHVYVNIDSWDKLFQDANLDPREVAKEVMGDTTVYDAAREAGGEADLQIPTEMYVKKLAGTQFNSQLVQDIRIDPEHMTSRQAEQVFKDLAEIEAVDNLDEVDPDVMARLNAQLRAAGFDAQTAEDNANLPGNFLSTMGQRAGLGEATALLDKYGLDVSRDSLPQDQSGTVIAGQSEAPAKIRVSSNALHDYTTGEVTSTDHTVTLHKPGESLPFGKATVTEGNGELRVLRTDVDEADQGKGHGQAMYLKMLSMARDRGLKLVSDKSVSPAAARRYAALKKMGYAVTENPNTVNPETGSMISNDPRKGVFEVDPGVQLEQKGKTIKAYKQFRTKKSQPGKLFPLFIGNNTPVEMGKWIDAEFIPTPGFAHRPGWHAGILPIAPHLRSKKSGGIASDRVWAEVEIPNTKEWQSKADAQGGDIRGEVPVGGHYRFNRPAMQGGSWIIGGSVKVNRVLNDSEVAQLLKDEGFSKKEIAAEMKNSEGIFEQFLHQGPASSQAEDAKWSVWEPEVTSTGVIKGAPEWVKTQADMRKLYKQLAQRISEGLVGRYWYEESAKQILAIANGNFQDAERLTRLVAIYSPQSKVQVNTIFAIRAWNQWKNGVPRENFKVKTEVQDKKAIAVLYDNDRDISLISVEDTEDMKGRKINSFYLNLMQEIFAMPESRDHIQLDKDLTELLDKPATIDVWMYRAFGYERHQAGDDVGAGKYSFAENAVRKITAELNLLLAPGEARWSPHQIQAVVWTAMKARYELAEVKDATWKESIKKGFASLNEKGQRTLPTTPEAVREHLKIWYKHAMKVTTEVAHEEANRTAASFKDFIKQMTMMVTWEADPSTKLNEPINGASFEVKRAFTASARALLIGENGEDLLAQQLGVPLATMSEGIGGYNSSAAPNVISRLIPTKPADEYSLEEVRLYAAAIQYIFKQDAVPWMRPDSRALDAKAAQKEQAFYLAAPVAKKKDADPNEPTKWRTITGASSFETQAAAEAHMASLRAWSAVRQFFNKEKKAKELEAAAAEMTVRGGPYARSFQFTFAQELGEAGAKELQTAIEAALGTDGGFTRISPDKVLVTNFRGSDGVPFGMDDETFVYKLHELADNSPAIVDSLTLWSQGEYGYVHDWESDPQGKKIIDERGLAGRPGLLDWVQGRRVLYEALLKEFSGANLDGLEATTEVLNQPAYHGTRHKFKNFSLQFIGTGEGNQAYGWGIYLSDSLAVAAWYRDMLAGGNPLLVNLPGGAPLAIGGKHGNFNNEARQIVDRMDKTEFEGVTDNELVVAVGRILLTGSALGQAGPSRYIAGAKRAANAKITVERNNIAATNRRSFDDDLKRQLNAVGEAIIKDAELQLQLLDVITVEKNPQQGHLYHAEIPDSKDMLDWDKGLGEQTPEVQKLLLSLIKTELTAQSSWINPDGTLKTGPQGKDLYMAFTDNLPRGTLREMGVGSEYEYASKKLLAAGIPGLTYEGAKPTVHNFVIFDDTRISITKMEQEERGYIAISPDMSMRIGLLANADLSTYIHESGHAFLRIFRDLTNQLRAMPVTDLNELQHKMLDDADALTKWMGITSLNDMKIEHEEQFARGFEAYTMEGKAPSVALRSSFNRFRTWLLAIYKKLVALNVTLNPEVRGVFDRMLATDEQIAAAKEDTASAPAFTSAAEMGVSPRVYEVYRKKIEDANRTATEELQQKLMAEYAREKESWWQERTAEVRAKVEGELSIQPDYLARSVLRTGKLPDGDELKLKLDRGWIKENMPEAMPSLRGMTAVEGGVTPDQAASLLGFASGDELLDSLTSGNGNLTPYREAVESETQKRMYAEYGDIRNDGTMADAARLAVQNDNRQQVVLAEIAAIDKLRKAASALQNAERVDRNEKQRHGAALLRAVPPLAVVRRVAQGRIAQTQIKDVQPGQWLVNARKEARAAEKALIAQDYHLAALHKQRELLAVELYREAVKAKAKVDEGVKYLRSFARPKVRAPIGKAGQQYLQQIDNLTASINLDRPTRAPGAFTAAAFTSYEEFVAARAAAGQEVDTSTMEVAQATVGRPYRELTADELEGLVAGVKHVAHLARHHNKLLRAQMKMELDELAATLVATAEKNSKGLLPAQIETALPQHTVAKWFGQFLASMRKMSSLAREMDGLVDGGPFWDALVRPLNEAADAEIVLRTAAAEKLQELLAPYLTTANRAKAKVTTMTQGLIEAGMFKPQRIPAINMSLTKAGELMVALNWGNELNRMRLMDGYGWNATQVQVVLDRLTAEDWQIVQGVWDHLDSYWPEIKALAERVDGVAPERVQPIAIETQFGLLRGGYFPISFDQELSPKAHELDAKEQAARSMHGAGIRASTAKGHRQNRVQASTGNALQIRLDIGAIYKHLNNVIHDLTHYEALIDVNRVLKHPSVRRAIIGYYGKRVFDQFETGLVDVAAGEVGATTPFERMVNHLRNGVSVAAMGYNFMTAIIQPLGLTQSMVRIGPLWVWKGISRWFRDGATLDHGAETVWSKSPFMAHRSQTMTREINDIRNTMEGGTQLSDTYFWLIGKMQMVVDMPTWLGAYERAYGLDPDMTEDRAIAMADQAVRDSQGSGLTVDLAKIQRGSPLMKLFTNFYSFFNVTYNLASEEISKAHGLNGSPRMILNFLMLYTVPAILGQILQDALRGGAPDDPEKAAWRLLQTQLSFIFGTVVGLREIGGAVQGYYGYSGPAGARGFGELSGFLKQTIQAVNEGETDAAFWKSLNNTAGILLHYPSTQIQRTVEGMIAYTQSNNQTPLVLITGPERKAK